MITTKDIRAAINQQLNKTGVEINSEDVKEGFKRPSFFVQLDSNIRTGELYHVTRSLFVHIYYYPTDRYEYAIEALDMGDTLGNLFDMKLPVKDRMLNVDEFSTFLNDGVLNCTFDLEFSDSREIGLFETDAEPMEELYIENVKE